MMGTHRLCALELFKGNKGGIKENCKVEVLTNTILPQTINISDGVSTLATQSQFDSWLKNCLVVP